MKIGIVSELNTNTVNFGNHLQAYALNLYLRRMNEDYQVESLLLPEREIVKYTNILSWSFCKKVFRSLNRRIKERIYGDTEGNRLAENDIVRNRLAQFAEFRAQYIPGSNKRPGNCDYDVMITGSDIVWQQYEHKVRRLQFLDCKEQKAFCRIAYAASFGSDRIPAENIKTVQAYLKKFNAISVREHSSVQMLEKIGIYNAAYCLDPTLLLEASDWEQLEKRPGAVAEDEKYLFVYLLGNSEAQRTKVTEFARKIGSKIATISYPHGNWDDLDFGDIRIDDCAIENWVWLIHHAQAVVTDSFHGVVFSTIFEKPFYALERDGSTSYGNRIPDYLREIGQTDKLIPPGGLNSCENLQWDYSNIRKAIEERKESSKAFLEKVFEDIKQ